ncbi:uncharacterized protein F4822DRAFT_258795 [Hypoxylon trugodes]|uniref:uncharacterized protein n=1 Tax=Hypoxylon trugodes TaxID=326681 RepID=UPI0021964311|nr:uncharacterized protein F4822DRAFT_258795 [Hypoxylon trugodes]KAI1388807.1 hypothetical protein F4822DRAFT_258795 [Hypoxylon trugodes]
MTLRYRGWIEAAWMHPAFFSKCYSSFHCIISEKLLTMAPLATNRVLDETSSIGSSTEAILTSLLQSTPYDISHTFEVARPESSASNEPRSDSDSHRNGDGGAIVGIVLGVLVGLFAIWRLIFLYRRFGGFNPFRRAVQQNEPSTETPQNRDSRSRMARWFGRRHDGPDEHEVRDLGHSDRNAAL